ncbi:MAG: hypothetical protein COA58_01125 [Bacteroidetes bacterium]|nr:MAG: hypothetical protein COA58_01125 [Bacteroidota bacterium]
MQGDKLIIHNTWNTKNCIPEICMYFPFAEGYKWEYSDFCYELATQNALSFPRTSFCKMDIQKIASTRDGEDLPDVHWQCIGSYLIKNKGGIHLNILKIDLEGTDQVRIYEHHSPGFKTDIYQFTQLQHCDRTAKYQSVKCIKTFQVDTWHSGERRETTRYFGFKVGLISCKHEHYDSNGNLLCIELSELKSHNFE